MNKGKSGAHILKLQEEIATLKGTLLDKDEEIGYLKDEITKLQDTLPALECCGECEKEEIIKNCDLLIDEKSVLLAERDQADEKVMEQDRLIQAKNEQLLAFKNILESEALEDLLKPIE